jgi:hypothetical protein
LRGVLSGRLLADIQGGKCRTRPLGAGTEGEEGEEGEDTADTAEQQTADAAAAAAKVKEAAAGEAAYC